MTAVRPKSAVDKADISDRIRRLPAPSHEELVCFIVTKCYLAERVRNGTRLRKYTILHDLEHYVTEAPDEYEMLDNLRLQ